MICRMLFQRQYSLLYKQFWGEKNGWLWFKQISLYKNTKFLTTYMVFGINDYLYHILVGKMRSFGQQICKRENYFVLNGNNHDNFHTASSQFDQTRYPRCPTRINTAGINDLGQQSQILQNFTGNSPIQIVFILHAYKL